LTAGAGLLGFSQDILRWTRVRGKYPGNLWSNFLEGLERLVCRTARKACGPLQIRIEFVLREEALHESVAIDDRHSVVLATVAKASLDDSAWKLQLEEWASTRLT
jgi:hypothetical protein